MHSALSRSASLVLPQAPRLVAPISGGVAALQRPQLKPKYQPEHDAADPFMEQQQVKPLPGQIGLRSLTRADVSPVLDAVLSAYLDTAPLNRAVRLELGEAEVPYGERIEDCAAQGSSFLAVDEDNGKIVGVILNEKLEKGRFHYTSKYAPKLATIAALLRHVEGDQFAQLSGTAPHAPATPAPSAPAVRRILTIHDALVRPGYQNHGIAKQLMALAVAEASAARCDYITGTASSPLTRRILQETVGFKPVRSCNTMTYTDPETQERPFQCIAHSSPQVTFMARKLDNSQPPSTRPQMG